MTPAPEIVAACETYLASRRVAADARVDIRPTLLGMARRELLAALPPHASTLYERLAIASDPALAVICQEVCGRPSTSVKVCPSSLCVGSGFRIDVALDDDHHGRCGVCNGRGVVALTEAEALGAGRVNDETTARALWGTAA